MTPAERREAHKINGATPLMDKGFDAAHVALEQAYALLQIIETAAGETDEIWTLNSQILSRAFDGIQHLVAEAHFNLFEMRGERNG